MSDKIPFWKRTYPSDDSGTFGDYDYTPRLRTVLIWIVIFLVIGAVIAHFIPAEDLTALTVNV